MKSHARQLFWNAILLSSASLLIRTVGVTFQVYVSNRAGAEAMGLFSLMSGVYGFALTLATSGIHLGVTRLVVDSIGEGRSERIRPAMKRATVYAILFGFLASALLIGGADIIGKIWLKDVRTVSSLRLLGITLPLIALSSAWSGYFTAVRRPYKNAIVQVLEQTVKIFATMQLLAWLLPYGVELTCCALVVGGVAAEAISFFLEFGLYLADRKKHFQKNDCDSGKAEGKKLLSISLPIAFTTYIRSGLITLQHILIPEGLRNSGASHAKALIAYGSIHSMAMPIILYPAALISSFSGLLVPELAESSVQKSTVRIQYIISRVWSLSLIFSIGVAGVLICFSNELGEALYPGTETAEYIRILAPLIPIMYLDTATDAMMKGLGEQLHSMKINIADALISVILVWLLIPKYGIRGYIFAIYFSEFFNTVCSITHLLSISLTRVRLLKWIYKPLIAIVIATTVLGKVWSASYLYIPNKTLSIILHCTSTVLLYLLLLIVTRGLDKEDLQWIKQLFSRKKLENG